VPDGARRSAGWPKAFEGLGTADAASKGRKQQSICRSLTAMFDRAGYKLNRSNIELQTYISIHTCNSRVATMSGAFVSRAKRDSSVLKGPIATPDKVIGCVSDDLHNLLSICKSAAPVLLRNRRSRCFRTALLHNHSTIPLALINTKHTRWDLDRTTQHMKSYASPPRRPSTPPASGQRPAAPAAPPRPPSPARAPTPPPSPH